MKKKINNFIGLCLLLFFVFACGAFSNNSSGTNNPTSQNQVSVTPTELIQQKKIVATVVPTATPTPIETPTPEPTVVPTQEPVIQQQPPAYVPEVTRYCCKMCSKGKACGDSCISRDKACHVGEGCACDS